MMKKSSEKKMADKWSLVAIDFAMCFVRVWSSVLIKVLVHKVLGYGARQVKGQIFKYAVSILNMFLFAYVAEATEGGSDNPLAVLGTSITGDFSDFIFALGARIPAQVLGSVYGVQLIVDTFPGIGHGPHLNVGIAKGALTEGLLTFTVAIVCLGLSKKTLGSFFMATWISSVAKLTLHMLGSDLTGGCMNPATVLGWAFAQGKHTTKEHWIVYWLGPVLATFAAVWVFGMLARSKKSKARRDAKKNVTSSHQWRSQKFKTT